MPPSPRFFARLLSPNERPAWETALQRCSTPPSMTHHWDYLDWASGGVGTPRRVVVETRSREIIAQATFVERRVRGFSHWRHPAPATFGGISFLEAQPSESLQRDVQTVLGSFLKGKASTIELALPPSQVDARGLIWSGWQARPHYNYISKIDRGDALMAQAENAVRRQYNKAVKEGLELRVGPELLGEVLQLYTRTCQRQQISRWVPEDFFRSFMEGWKVNDEPGALVVAVVPAGGGPIEAGAVLGRNGERVAYLLGASHQEDGAITGAATFLQFEATRHCFEKWGEFEWDWVGANTPSVAQFKKKFRPRLEVGIRATWQSRWARRISEL